MSTKTGELLPFVALLAGGLALVVVDIAGASGDGPPTHAAGSTRPRATARAANWALYWTVAFIALHAYWYLGGRVGFGDQVDPLPGAPSSLGDWIFYVVTGGMWVAGLVVPSALARPWGRRVPRRLLVWLMWIGCAVLVARGGSGLLDDALRFTGVVDGGLTGLSNKDVLGSADPSTYTMLSTVAIDSIFLAGGLLFGHAARLARDPRRRRLAPDADLDASGLRPAVGEEDRRRVPAVSTSLHRSNHQPESGFGRVWHAPQGGHMTEVRTAIVIGGGIAGPVAAMALQRADIEATVYEAHDTSAEGVGAAMMLAPNGLNALRVLDAADGVREIGTPSPRMIVKSGTGKRLAEFRDLSGLPTAQTVAREDLYRILYREATDRGVEIEHGRRLVAVEQDDDGVTAQFADGSEAEGDVLIGADGIGSTVRTLIDPAAPHPEYGGMVGFGSWLPDSGLEPTDGTYYMMFGKHGFFAYIVAEDRRTLWFANVPHDRQLSIADARAVPAEEWLELLRRTFAEDNSPALEILRRVDPSDLMTTGTKLALPTPKIWHRGRMIIIGDAAHAASTSSGQGASMAIESAIELARCLRDLPTVPEAFARYERLRRPRVEKVIAHGERTDNKKAPGPVGRVLRDLLMPPAMKLVARPRSMAWLFEHTIDWDAPAGMGAAARAPVNA
jgi:FAD-dependent urate hydroxylase